MLFTAHVSFRISKRLLHGNKNIFYFRKYIEKYLDDTITLFPELVEKFNQNKLYNQIPDMKQHDISRFVEFEDEADYYSMVVNERENYLFRHGIAI